MASVIQWDKPVSGNIERDAKSFDSNLDESPAAATSAIGEKVEKATMAVSAGMESLGIGIRNSVPKDGILGTAGQAVGDCLESTGHYLEENGFNGVGEKMTKVIQNNPIPALLVGMGVGFLLAKFIRR